MHSEYSALDGFGSAQDYINRVVQLGMKYCAITDHGTIAGALKFQKECLKKDIIPIIGAELYMVPDITTHLKEKPAHITILCTNLKGFQELSRLITFSNLQGFYKKPKISYDALLNSDLSGFIIMTACLGSFLNLKDGINVLLELEEKMPGRLYLEIMPHREDIQKNYHKNVIIPLKKETGLPLVATNDCHYVNRGDWMAQEMLLAVQRNAKWSDPNRFKFSMKGLHLRSEIEMRKAFERQGQFSEAEIDEAINNTHKIAKQCENFRIPKQEIALPCAPGTEGENANKILEDLCIKKIDELLLSNEYEIRFDNEFELIKSKNFAQYFLIFYDIIQYCNNNNIEYGPGRGSAGGSLIAFLLGIHKLDPIKFDLSFARFLQEDRIDWPDIDVDFQHDKREQVVQYIKDTYGETHTCGISTDSRMKAKGVIWDVGRSFEMLNKDISPISHSLDNFIKQNSKEKKFLDKYFTEDETGMEFAEKWAEASKLMIKLENQLRHFGQHPAAVCISADDLTLGKYGSLRKQGKNIVSSFDMEDSEHIGLMKLDILGLSTLSVLAECRRLIHEKNPDFNFDKIPLEDKEVFDALSDGNTSGVFQMEEWASTNLCKEMGVDNFNDMIAINALVRPGPYKSGMTSDYIKRKHGEKWESIHPIYSKITEYTYGVLVYQEQVMNVISKVAGLSEAEADKIRKVIGKKRDPKEFEPHRIKFFEGCKKQNTLSQAEAEEFWEGLLKWAGYGFNKSHSTAYAMLGLWTGYCKVHYPREFLCASLTYTKKGERQDLVDEAQRIGLKLMLPKVDISDSSKWVVKNDILYVPFTEINTFGEKQAEKYCKSVIDNAGFFKIKSTPDTSTQMGKILLEIGAYNPDQEPDPEVMEKHFSFGVSDKSDPAYKSLKNILGFNFPEEDLIKIKSLDVPKGFLSKGLIKPVRRFQNKELLKCKKCELRKECKKPVLPSPGIFNVVISGEGPGWQEDKYGYGFYEGAPAGKTLWDELGIYGLSRRLFYVTNIVKCFPGKVIKTPNKSHMDNCSVWFAEELANIKPRLMLAFGNTNNKALTDRSGGINKLSGTTEWIDEIKCFVCWCTHPAATKRNMANLEYFEKGIKNFAEKFELLKG